MKAMIYGIVLLFPFHINAMSMPQWGLVKPYLPWMVAATSVVAALFGALITKKLGAHTEQDLEQVKMQAIEDYKNACKRQGIIIVTREDGNMLRLQNNAYYYNFLNNRASFSCNSMYQNSELNIVTSAEAYEYPFIIIKKEITGTQIILDSSIYDLKLHMRHRGRDYQLKKNIKKEEIIEAFFEKTDSK